VAIEILALLKLYHCLSVDILAQLKERRDTYFVVSIECDRIPVFPTLGLHYAGEHPGLLLRLRGKFPA